MSIYIRNMPAIAGKVKIRSIVPGLEWQTISIINAVEETAFDLQLSVARNKKATFSIIAGSLPEGILISGNSLVGILPNVASLGRVYEFTLRATDTTNGLFADQQFVLTVNNVNKAPVWITPSVIPQWFTGDVVNQALVAQDRDNDTVVYQVVSGQLPVGLTMSTNGIITGTVAFSNASGAFSFTVSASDGIDSTTRTFTASVVNTALDHTQMFYSPHYTGSGNTAVLTNMNLYENGAMIWLRNRDAAGPLVSYDSARNWGSYVGLSNNSSPVTTTPVTIYSDGYSDPYSRGNTKSWIFRKQPKFLDIVTWTGTGGVLNIPHNLNATPGFIIVRPLASEINYTYHESVGATSAATLIQNTGFESNTLFWNNVSPTTTHFTVGAKNNVANRQYVAYLFANDTSPASIVKTGAYFVSNIPVEINLNWSPRMLLVRSDTINTATPWLIMGRETGTAAWSLSGNSAPMTIPSVEFFANGFKLVSSNQAVSGAGIKYVYLAIR